MSQDKPPSVKHRLQYTVVRLVGLLAGIVPLKAGLAAGALLGRVAWSIMRMRRDIVVKNLRQAFPDMSLKQLHATALHSYMNSGRFMIEFIRQGGINEKYIERHIAIPGNLDRLRKEKRALVITGHFDNWELFGVVIKHYLGNVSFLVGKQSNILVDRYINNLRTSRGLNLYNRKNAVRGVLSTSRRGGYVCWVSDQDAGANGIVVDFLGYPASTPRGAAAFAVKLGVPVVFGVLVRDGVGPDHRLMLSEPIRPLGGMSVSEAEKYVTQRYTSELEKIVRLYPEQYWWAHRRWKSTGFYRVGQPPASGAFRLSESLFLDC